MLKVVVFLGTVPYYRFFQFNTLGPILRIAKYSSQRGQSRKVYQLLVRWRTRKLAELQLISIAVSSSFPRISSKPCTQALKTLSTEISVCHNCRRRYWFVLLERGFWCVLGCSRALVQQPCTFDLWIIALDTADCSAAIAGCRRCAREAWSYQHRD